MPVCTEFSIFKSTFSSFWHTKSRVDTIFSLIMMDFRHLIHDAFSYHDFLRHNIALLCWKYH